MQLDQKQQIETLVKAFGFLQLKLLEENLSKKEIEKECESFKRQISALLKTELEKRDYAEKLDIERKREIQTLRKEREDAKRDKERAEAKAAEAFADAHKEQYRRQIVEAENRGLLSEIYRFNHPNYLLDVVDDIQECPKCGGQQLDREADDTCVCRYCMSRYALELHDGHPF